MVQKLDTLWQRPLKGLERYTAGRPVNLPHIGIPGMPSELPLLHAKPSSILTSEMERVGTHMAEKTKSLVDQPWAKETLKQSPDVIKDIENSRVADFMTRMTTGGMSPTQAKAASMANAPQWFQEADAFRVATKAGPYGENWAKRFLGLQQTPERWGPYWARNVVKDETASLRGTQGLFGELRTSVGPAERARKYPTMRAGEQAGIQYDDPRVAWLNREVHALRLIETAKFMQRLENRVVFRTEAAAKAAGGGAHALPMHEILGMPGAPTWYVPYKEEWKFLVDNLSSPEWGKLGFLRSWSNSLARNPNLVNPLPHIVKNMAYKYRLAGGRLSQLPGDWMEFQRGTSPMVSIFKQVMPFESTGQTAEQVYHRAVNTIRQENYPAVARLTQLGIDATLGRAQRASSKIIFSQADPAMRYSLWKQYVAKGMPPEEAAQNVWIDLIRYGTRSTIVDAWKSVPFNFFVPWRLGTVTSLYKQLTQHPLRTAMIVGGIDLLREIRYRQSGQWTHLPIDYIEQPIAQVIQGKDVGDSAKSLVAATLATIAFGPGGAYAASTIKDLMDDIQMRGEKRRLINMFWGLSQAYEIPAHGYKVIQALNAGNGALAASEASKMLTSIALAEHTALNYRPRRLLAALPEVGPWLQKSAQVKAAEQMQQAIERKGEVKERRREIYRGRTIEDRVKALEGR